MLKNLLFATVRWTVFIVATITAVVLTFAAAGVVFTMSKWGMGTETAAFVLMGVLCGILAGIVWVWKRRFPKQRSARTSRETVAGWAVGVSALLIAIGWLMSRLPVTPPLTVVCLRPLGGMAAPLLVSALSDGEADVQALELLLQHPEAALRQLPRLEDLVRRDPPGGRHGYTHWVDETGKKTPAEPFAASDAIEVIASLGPAAVAAAPTLVQRVSVEVSDVGETDWSPTNFDSVESKSPSSAWLALTRIGGPAVPAIIDGFKSTGDFRVRLVLVSVLRHIGSEIEPAVPVLLDILKDPSQGFSKDECIERVLWTLRDIGSPAQDAIPIITPWAVDESNSDVNRSAIATLGAIGNGQDGSVRTLLEIIENPDWGYESSYASRQQLAVEALGQMGPDATAAIPRLVDLIDTEGARDFLGRHGSVWKQSDVCIRALARIGPNGQEEVVKLLPGPYWVSAVQALEQAVPAARDAAPALHDAFAKADRVRQFPLAMAIERIEGPSDAIVAVIADYLTLPDDARFAVVGDRSYDVMDRLNELGPAANAAVPALTKVLAEPGHSDRWQTARTLWNIDHNAPAVLPAVVQMLHDESAKAWHRLDPDWLRELDPTGEQVVPALAEALSQTTNDAHEIVDALGAYGGRARSAVPAVRAAHAANKIYGGSFASFLWNVSAWDFLRYSLEGRLAGLFALAAICLVIECLWFRRRYPLLRSISRSTARSGSDVDSEEWGRNVAAAYNQQDAKPSGENEVGGA